MNNYINTLHKNSEGFITVAKMKKHWQQYYFEGINDLSINLNDKDVYISQNTFNNRSRRLTHLKELKALYIDIDCYKVNLSKEAVKYFLENDLYGQIPVPNMLIDSGRGLYYIIFLENTIAEELPKWQLVERYLFEKLKDLGADNKALDATRVLRVVGSTNSKNNELVKVIDTYDYQYTLDEIIENYIPEVNEDRKEKQKPKGVRKKGRKKKFVSLFNLYNLYYTRFKDIKKLVEIRNYEMTGYREITLFLIRYFLNVYHGDDDLVMEEVIEINNSFTEPLEINEVFNATRSGAIGATESVYKYSNDKLIKLLDITPSEQKEMATIIGKSEKYYRNNKNRRDNRRDENGLTQRESSKLNNENEILELKRKKYTLKQISKKLNLSIDYVKKVSRKANR
jgi:DNA-binding CsgD family transcriptional regulator